MNTVAKEKLATDLTSVAVRQKNPNGGGVLDSMFGTNAQTEMVVLPNSISTEMVHNLVDNFSDTESVSGDFVALSPNAVQINLTARDFIFEPKLLEIIASTHAPYKSAVNSGFATFDDTGKNEDGEMAYELSAAFAPGIYGYAYRLNCRDTNRGTTTLMIENPSGADVKVQLKNIMYDAWVVVLNNVLDQTSQILVANVPVPAAPTEMNFTNVLASVNEQYTFTTVPGKIKISGINVNVDIYPINVRRETNAIVSALYYADRMQDLALAFLASYAYIDHNERSVQ